MYACGLKVSEIANLNSDDIDVSTRILNLHQKGLERAVPLPEYLLGALYRYDQARRKRFGSTEPFFLNSRGQRISRTTILQIVKNTVRDATGRKDVHPELVRHAHRSSAEVFRYLHYIRDGRKLKPHTVDQQTVDLRQFAQFLKGRFPSGWKWKDIKEPTVISFVLSLEQRGFTLWTLRRKLSSVRSFFEFLRHLGIVNSNPTAADRALVDEWRGAK